MRICTASSMDRQFAELITLTNMGPHYDRHGLSWRSELFQQEWEATDNYLLYDGVDKVGILRLFRDTEAMHIRDLQIVPPCQNRGAGSWALDKVKEIAGRHTLSRIRLQVFLGNRARDLYERYGFMAVVEAPPFLGMELSLQAEGSTGLHGL